MDLAAQLGVGEVAAGEDGVHRPAEFFQGGVGGVLGAAAGEPAQHLLGLRRAQPERGGVADHLVVLLAISSQRIGRVSTDPRAAWQC